MNGMGTWGKSWENLATGITQYYGGGIDSSQYKTVVNYLNTGEYTMEEMESILQQIPEMKRTYNANGELIRVSYDANITPAVKQSSTVASQVNSNVAQATAGKTSTIVNDVQNVSVDAQTGKATISNNVTKYTSGTAGTVKAVATSALQGVFATSVGITLGKTINQIAYDAGFNWLEWAGVEMESLNPETWSNITDGDDSLGASLFNFIFQIDPTTGDPQPYMDENVFAYMTAYMLATGVFDNKTQATDYEPITPLTLNHGYTYPIKANSVISTWNGSIVINNGYGFVVDHKTTESATDYSHLICFTGDASASYTMNGTTKFIKDDRDVGSVVLNGVTYYYVASIFAGSSFEYVPQSTITDYVGTIGVRNGHEFARDMCLAIYNNSDIFVGGVEGIDDQTGATQFDTSGISDPSDISAVLTALQTQYPELWDNRIEYSTDGQNVFRYIPVGFPTGGTGSQPTTNGATQADTAPKISEGGENVTDELIKTLIEAITQNSPTMSTDPTTPIPTTTSPNPPNTGTGDTPLVVAPTGSASALWKIYNPSQSELDAFGAWLWSSNFVDQLLKVFNDPMQAIIGLHKVFVTPPVSGSGVIKVGYLPSNATANYVSGQYVDVDCGEVDVSEYFGNVFDYDPFTKINMFLPFIGFVPLSVSDCMRGSLSVVYHVDVLTGQCLAEISVKRDLHENVLYTYAGNCAVQYPVSSGSYVGILGGLLGVAGTIASGGALAPVAIGAMSAVGGIHTDVKHSGNIHGSAGAMGCKTPYIVIERPQTALPANFEYIEGEPQNEFTTLNACVSDFVKVKKGVYNISAERNELNMIRELLESGVYI